jgi:nicotinate-nucleotide adenylyltransferase
MAPDETHPWGKKMTPYHHRFNMCREVCRELTGATCSLPRQNSKSSYTIDLIEFLQELYPNDQFTLILGADAWEARQKWHRWEDLEKLVDFFVVGRQGTEDACSVKMPNVSSSEVRRRIQAGESVDELLPQSVVHYIKVANLYKLTTEEEKK